MNQTQLEELQVTPVGTNRFMTVIFNNDHTPQDVVVAILIKATGCTAEEAMIEMWEAEHYGKAAVHFANESECKRVATIIESVGVKTTVQPEWDD